MARRRISWAYLAGFTDGDGCIHIKTNEKGYLEVRIRWAQRESTSVILDEIKILLRHYGISVSDTSTVRHHKYYQREICVKNNGDVRFVLRKLLPNLVLKKQTALEALEKMDEINKLKEIWGREYKANMRKAGVAYG